MNLEMKRLAVEAKRIEASKAELEFKIEELLADIERIKINIQLQDKRLLEINNKLNG